METPSDVLTNETSKNYCDFYLNWTGPILNEQFKPYFYGNKKCDICLLNSKLRRKSLQFKEWEANFSYLMLLKPLFCSVPSLYCGNYINAWIHYNEKSKEPEELPENSYRTWKDYLTYHITPELFQVHFILRPCYFGSNDYKDTEILAELIGAYNALILKVCTPYKDVFFHPEVTEMEYSDHDLDYKSCKDLIRNTVDSVCRGECFDVTSSIVKEIKEEMHLKSRGEFSKLMKCHERNENYSKPLTLTSSTQHDHTYFLNCYSPDKKMESEGCYGPLELIKKLFTVELHPRSRLSVLRWNSLCPFLDINQDQPSTLSEECLLCNMLCFKVWYDIIENKIIGPILNEINSKPDMMTIMEGGTTCPSANFCEKFNAARQKDLSQLTSSQRQVYQFLLFEVGENAFYKHVYSAPICGINRARAKTLFSKNFNDVSCGKSLIFALLYHLFIRAKRVFIFNSTFKIGSKILSLLLQHNIYADRQSIFSCGLLKNYKNYNEGS